MLRFGILLLGFAAAALADSAKIAKDLGRSDTTVRVIVQYQTAPTQADLDQVTAQGGHVRQELSGVKAIALEISAARLEKLAASKGVVYISPDRPLKSSLDYTVPAAGADLALRYGYDAAGVTVAVIDSGIADHPDLAARVLYRESFVDPPAKDKYGHGTHVAGIVAGNGAQSGGAFRGIAPRASLVDLQALDSDGVGSDSSVVRAIERAVELKDTYGIRVVNLSLGRP